MGTNQVESTNESKKKYIWIDPQIDSIENTSHYKNLFLKKKIKCKKYNNIDEAYDYLIQKKTTLKKL